LKKWQGRCYRASRELCSNYVSGKLDPIWDFHMV